MKKETVLKRLNEKYGKNFIFYTEKDYNILNGHDNINIICSEHGETKKQVGFLLNKKGNFPCKLCSHNFLSLKFRSNLKEFVNKVKSIHGDKYDYSKVEYINNNTKILIVCFIHGDFEQLPSNHLAGKGCSLCGDNATKLALSSDTEEFINKAKKIHKDKYDYSGVNYKSNSIKVKIVCHTHGEFYQSPAGHLSNKGCPKCSIDKKTKTNQTFIKESNIVHKNKYIYSRVDYKHSKTKVIITCPKHGDFHQEPRTHLSGKGCPKCSHNYKLTKETFIEKAKLIHGDRYTYEFVYYVDWQTKVEITCNIHGPFFQKPNSHLSGHGCHRCTESNGEKLIAGILEKNNINFIREYIIPNQKYKFRYDFYLPDLNVFIEFHGGQHYKPIDFFGGEEGFKDTKRRDIFKKELAKMVKIPIIVFNYKHMRLPKHIYEKYVLKKITNKVNE